MNQNIRIDSAMLHELLHWRGKNEPDKFAFKFLGGDGQSTQSLTYKKLDQQARTIAAELRKTSFEGERAILLFAPGLEFTAAFFGCLYAGIIAVPAHPPRSNQAGGRTFGIADNCSASLVLTTLALYSKLERTHDLENIFGKDVRWLQVDQLESVDPTEELNVKIHNGSPAMLQYTSGSTTEPKGVIITHRQFLENAQMIQSRFRTNKNSVCVSWLPVQHDMGLMGGILQPVYLGIPAVLMSPTSFLQRPVRWLRAITDFDGTITVAPNFAYELCVQKISSQELKSLDLTKLDIAGVGAEPVRADTLKKFAETFSSCGFKKESFLSCYGLAEATLFVTGCRKNTLLEARPSNIQKQQIEEAQSVSSDSGSAMPNDNLICCGKPLDFQRIITVNPFTLEKLPDGEIGEVWVSSPNLASGYWNDPLQTNITFNAYTANIKEGPFLRTGDLGFINDDGIYITGRLRDVIIVRGQNHYPQDIEHTVEKHLNNQAPNSCACFSVQGDQLVVLIESGRKTEDQLDRLANVVQIEIAREHGLEVSSILFVKKRAIPKTTSGKIRRYASKKMFLANGFQQLYKWEYRESDSKRGHIVDHEVQTPQWAGLTKTESIRALSQWLLEQVAAYRGIEPSAVDMDKSFLDFGLDSVALMEISGKLEVFTGFAVSPTSFFDYSTIKTLSRYLIEEQTGGSNDSRFEGEKSSRQVTAKENEFIEVAALSDEEIENRLEKLVANNL